MMKSCLLMLLLGVLAVQSGCCRITKVTLSPYLGGDYNTDYQYPARYLRQALRSHHYCPMAPKTLPQPVQCVEPIFANPKDYCSRCQKCCCQHLPIQLEDGWY